MVVLLVEDDAIIRENALDELADAGFSVVEAETGDQALGIIEAAGQLDALFTDIRMPGRLDGWQVAEVFRAKHPNGIVLYASGYSVKHTPVSNSLFFRKPYRTQQVIWGLRALAGAAAATEGAEPDGPGWTVVPKQLPEPEL